MNLNTGLQRVVLTDLVCAGKNYRFHYTFSLRWEPYPQSRLIPAHCHAVATAVVAENYVAACVAHHKVVACRGGPVKTLNAAACDHGRLRDNVIAH
jgi:hypothetical protein